VFNKGGGMRKYNRIVINNINGRNRMYQQIAPNLQTLIAEALPQYFMVRLAVMRKVFY
jgi:hypothetical protein